MKDRETGTPRRWLALLTIIVATVALFVALARHIDGVPDEISPWRVDRAELMGATGAWYPVSLPHRIDAPAALATAARYRANLAPHLVADEPRALLVAQSFGRMEVYLDGVHVGGGGPAGASPRHRPPVFLLLPAALARAENSILEVHVSGGSQSLHALHVGPARDLKPAFETGWSVKVHAKQVILAVLLGVALMTALLFSLRVHERHFGWFSLATVAGAVHVAVSLNQGESPRSSQWEVFAACMAAWATIAAALFLNRLLGRERQTSERLLLAGGGVLLCASLVAGLMANPSLLSFTTAACYTFTIIVGAYLGVGLARTLQRNWNRSTCLLLVVVSLMAATHAVDRLDPTSAPLLLYTVIPALAIIGSLIIGRFVGALEESEALHRQIDTRVADSSRELERSLAQLEAVQREQALSNERQRIMRDMHDGVGGQLVQALSAVEADPALRGLGRKLRASLDDLRLVVDSFSHTSGNLAEALANMRWRTQRRCQQSQTRCEWRVEIDGSTVFRTEEVLQVLRAVQDGVDRALARSGNTVSVRVRLQCDAGHHALRVEVLRDETALVSQAVIALHHPSAAEHTR